MLKSFRSSDKKGAEGIEFGDEWYKAIMAKLEIASDVVCLLTERSLDRPWLLYEAGVAKGRLNTPVHGLALGVPLSRASTGPFYQFQNSDDSEDSLSTLVLQLCRRIEGLEPEQEVVRVQVQVFKSKVTEVVEKAGSTPKIQKRESIEEPAVAKMLEEMKLIVRDLPIRLEETLSDQRRNIQHAARPRTKSRNIPLGIIDELPFRLQQRDDPIGLLVLASLLKDEFPWLYEAGMEAYRSLRNRPNRASEALRRFRDLAEFTFFGTLAEWIRPLDKDTDMWVREVPSYIHHYMQRIDTENQPLLEVEPVTKPAKKDKST